MKRLMKEQTHKQNTTIRRGAHNDRLVTQAALSRGALRSEETFRTIKAKLNAKDEQVFASKGGLDGRIS